MGIRIKRACEFETLLGVAPGCGVRLSAVQQRPPFTLICTVLAFHLDCSAYRSCTTCQESHTQPDQLAAAFALNQRYRTNLILKTQG